MRPHSRSLAIRSSTAKAVHVQYSVEVNRLFPTRPYTQLLIPKQPRPSFPCFLSSCPSLCLRPLGPHSMFPEGLGPKDYYLVLYPHPSLPCPSHQAQKWYSEALERVAAPGRHQSLSQDPYLLVSKKGVSVSLIQVRSYSPVLRKEPMVLY
jgi:hypothetical protein